LGREMHQGRRKINQKMKKKGREYTKRGQGKRKVTQKTFTKTKVVFPGVRNPGTINPDKRTRRSTKPGRES